MQIIPQGNRILIELIEPDTGKIIVPDNCEMLDRSHFRIVALGEGRYLPNGDLIPIDRNLNVGDEISVDPNATALGQAMRLEPIEMFGGRKLMIVEVAAVMCKVVRDPGSTLDKPIFRRKKPKSPLKDENVPRVLN